MSPASKVILVTGASRGLGLACAEILLSKFDCQVVTFSRSLTDGLQQLKAKHDAKLEIVQGDVCNDGDQKKAVEKAVSTYGKLDGLVLNAGSLDPLTRVANAEMDEYKKLFDINFFSLVSMLKHALPYLRKSEGNCIFTSSGAATGNTTAWSAYNASKAALNSLCRTVANEEEAVTFVAVRPGVVATDMQDQLLAKGEKEMSAVDYKRFVDIHAQGARVPAEKPGHVLAALACSADKSLSGTFVNWSDDNMAVYASSQ